MSDQTAASKLDQGSHLPGDTERDFKSFADEGYDPGKVVPGGYDPGKVVKGSLRDELIRVAVTLPKGSEDRLALLELINGGDPGTRMVEARVAAEKEAKLRADTIRLAHRLPKGSNERKALLATLKEAGCEKLPNEKMQQMCEDKKKEGEKNDEKEKKEDKKAGEEAAQAEEAAQPGAVRKQDQPKTRKQRMNPTKLSPAKVATDKAALVRLASTMEKGSTERKAILELAAGCEKLPNEKMQQLCEEKKEEGKKNDAKEKKEDKKAKVKTDDECMKKFQDKDGSFKGGKGAAFKNCVKGFEECATGVTDAAGLCATIGREHGKMASADAKTAARNAFTAARAQGESHEVALLASKMAMRIRGE